MLGARVEIVRKTGPTLWRRARADGSYASANDPRVLVGLGDSSETPTVRVTLAGRPQRRSGRTWPSIATRRSPSGTRHDVATALSPNAARIAAHRRSLAGWPAAGCRRRRSSRRCRRQPAASPGSTTTRCRRTATCPRPWGPACAFLDYDNDGWMDIFLVNSGPADFYKPTDAAQERALQEQPRRHVHRRHRQGGRRRAARVRHGRAPSATTTTTAIPTSSSPPTAAARSTTTTATARSPTSPRRPGLAAPGWTTSAVWFDYDNDGKLDLFLCSFVEFALTEQRLLRRQQAGQALLLHPARLQADAEPALPQQRRRHLHRGQRRHRHRARARQGARRRRHRHQQRRPDGPVRRQRHGAEFPVRRTAARASGRRSALAAEVGFSANGTPRSGMGVDAADFDGDGRQDLFVANVDQEMFSLYQNDGNEFFSDVAARQRRRAGHAAAERLGPEVLRLRQRRLRRPVPRQRPPRRHDRELLAAGAVQGAAAAVPQRRRRSCERQRAGRARSSRRRSRRAASPSATSTTTAASTCSIGNNGGAPVLLKNNAGDGNHWLGREAAGHGAATATRSARRITWSAGGVDALAAEERRRQLPLVARPARGARPRPRHGDRLARDQVAAAERRNSSASRTSRSIATSRSSRARGSRRDPHFAG